MVVIRNGGDGTTVVVVVEEGEEEGVSTVDCYYCLLFSLLVSLVCWYCHRARVRVCVYCVFFNTGKNSTYIRAGQN